ncbi:phostensin [Rhinophrynus dorsalis]
MMEVPDWKVHLLERRRKEEEETKRRGKEEEERLAKMPAWKREIILRRKAKAEASMLESRAEADSLEQEEREKVDAGEREEREVTVLREKIGPVQQNPFIQQEKQRRTPEYHCTKIKLSPEPSSLRTTRMDDMVRDSHAAREEEDQKAPLEDLHPLTEDSTGIVSRLLSRFRRPWTEGENGVSLVNGEGELSSKGFCSPVVVAENDVQAPAYITHPPPPSCPQAETENQASTQETTLSSLTPPSSSCIDSEPAAFSPCVSSAAKSGLSTRPNMMEEARPFPFHLRPASPASPRPLKQTVQASPAIPRPEVLKPVTGKLEEEGEGSSGLTRSICTPQGNIKGNVESQAMQRRKGNTITVNPRKMAPCENGFAATETKAPGPKNESGKKRYPTVDEIKVIGGYQALSRSCIAKHSRDKKKLNISFPESELESTYEYPSESSLLAEFGPPDDSELLPPPNPQPEDDEEEESVLLGGIMRRKALIVDESCKR